MPISDSKRILSTPSAYAKEHYLYVQEVGSLRSIEPHISRRQNLKSFLFIIVVDGNGYFTYDAVKHHIAAGDCLLIDCARPYSHESSENNPWILKWVHFYGKQAVNYYENFLAAGLPFLFRPDNLIPFTASLESLYRTQDENTLLKELCSHKYITDIITLCFTENKIGQAEEYSISRKMQKVHEYLRENFAKKIRLDQLADHFFVSKYHLAREYKKVYGTTIGSTLMALRISHAKSLLRFSHDSIDMISSHCGFQDATYFVKVFKAAENMTPSEYRRKW